MIDRPSPKSASPRRDDEQRNEGAARKTQQPAVSDASPPPAAASYKNDDVLDIDTEADPAGSGKIRRAAQLTATLTVFGVAIVAALLIWNYYVTSPWTRNGRIRVQVASIAPQVSGQIIEVRVVDNQFVRKGDVLYVIDPFDYKAALNAAKAQEKIRAADLQVKKVQAERRQSLSDLAASVENKQIYVGNAEQAQASFEAAQVQVAQADVNLQRTEVKSPVNGYVTNLLLRVGDYATAGKPQLSIIDSDSYWIDGYFEETKMSRICIGDRVEARLMGYHNPIIGRVDTITRGISTTNATPGTQGLPGVDPVYTWVRLAQRVPVRIKITELPPEIPLIAGMTATVTMRSTDDKDIKEASLFSLSHRLYEVFGGHTPRADCISSAMSKTQLRAPPNASIEGSVPARPQDSDQLFPGLTPGMTSAPRSRL